MFPHITEVIASVRVFTGSETLIVLRIPLVSIRRFFGSNEIKVLLCIMLLRYDFRIEPGTTLPENPRFEAVDGLHPQFKLQARRRREEIDVIYPRKG